MELKKIHALAEEAASFGPNLNLRLDRESDDWDEDETEPEVPWPASGPGGPASPTIGRDNESQAAWKKAARARVLVETSLRARLSEIVSGDPDYAGLKLTLNVAARPASQKRPALDEILALILTEQGALLSQAEIQRRVRASYPALTVPKDWTTPVPSWAVKKLKARIAKMPAPFSSVALGRNVTLSSLHKKAKSLVLSTKEQAISFDARITIFPNELRIGDRTFKITTNKVKSHEYRLARVRIDQLLETAA